MSESLSTIPLSELAQLASIAKSLPLPYQFIDMVDKSEGTILRNEFSVKKFQNNSIRREKRFKPIAKIIGY